MTSDRPKILCLIDSLRMGGGAEQLLADLVPRMVSLGLNIQVAVLWGSAERDLGDELNRMGVTVHRLELVHPYSIADAARKLRALAQIEGFDIFWGHLYYGNFYASLAKRVAGRGAVVVTLHCVAYSDGRRKRVRDRLFRWVERLVVYLADLRVAVSHDVERDYSALFGRKNTWVIHNGTDCSRLDELARKGNGHVRSEFGFALSDFLIVMPASFLAKKGHSVVLEALESLRATNGFRPKVLFCGDGPLIEAVRTDVSRRGLNDQVVVSPAITHDKLLPLIGSAQLVVLASYAEGLSIAATEAMALGTPCIFTDIGSFRELTGRDTQSALLVPPGDPQALADAIGRIWSDPNLATALGENGRDRIRSNFDIIKCAKDWVATLNNVAIAAPQAARARISGNEC